MPAYRKQPPYSERQKYLMLKELDNLVKDDFSDPTRETSRSGALLKRLNIHRHEFPDKTATKWKSSTWVPAVLASMSRKALKPEFEHSRPSDNDGAPKSSLLVSQGSIALDLTKIFQEEPAYVKLLKDNRIQTQMSAGSNADGQTSAASNRAADDVEENSTSSRLGNVQLMNSPETGARSVSHASAPQEAPLGKGEMDANRVRTYRLESKQNVAPMDDFGDYYSSASTNVFLRQNFLKDISLFAKYGSQTSQRQSSQNEYAIVRHISNLLLLKHSRFQVQDQDFEKWVGDLQYYLMNSLGQLVDNPDRSIEAMGGSSTVISAMIRRFPDAIASIFATREGLQELAAEWVQRRGLVRLVEWVAVSFILQAGSQLTSMKPKDSQYVLQSRMQLEIEKGNPTMAKYLWAQDMYQRDQEYANAAFVEMRIRPSIERASKELVDGMIEAVSDAGIQVDTPWKTYLSEKLYELIQDTCHIFYRSSLDNRVIEIRLPQVGQIFDPLTMSCGGLRPKHDGSDPTTGVVDYSSTPMVLTLRTTDDYKIAFKDVETAIGDRPVNWWVISKATVWIL